MSVAVSQIREHMSVVGSDGAHVGTVDRVDGERIKLTRTDDPDGSKQHHHYLPLSAVMSAEGGQVRLNVSANRAKEIALQGRSSSMAETANNITGKVQESAEQAFSAARDGAEAAARRAGEWADTAYGKAMDATQDLRGTMTRTVERDPMVTLMVAGALGFALGALVTYSMRR